MKRKNREEIQHDITKKLIEYDLHGKLILATGVGKTKITIDALIKKKPKSVLWLCPTEKARDETIPNEFIKWGAAHLIPITDFVCYASLKKLTGEYQYGIFDEGQFVTLYNTKNINAGLHIDSILLLTGTEPTELDKIAVLESFNLPLIHEIDVDTAVELKLVAPYEIELHPMELDDLDSYIEAKKMYWTEKERYDFLTNAIDYYRKQGENTKLIALNRARMIYNSKSKLEYTQQLLTEIPKGERTLIFSKSIDIANKLSPYRFHSQSLKEKKVDVHYTMFNNLYIDQLSLVNSANQALNFIDVDGAIINQLDSNDRNLKQRIGRVVRLRPDHIAKIKIVYFKDTVDELWVKNSLKGLDKRNIYENKK